MRSSRFSTAWALQFFRRPKGSCPTETPDAKMSAGKLFATFGSRTVPGHALAIEKNLSTAGAETVKTIQEKLRGAFNVSSGQKTDTGA